MSQSLPEGYALVWATKNEHTNRGGKYQAVDACWETPRGYLYTSLAVRDDDTVESVMDDMIHDLLRYVSKLT